MRSWIIGGLLAAVTLSLLAAILLPAVLGRSGADESASTVSGSSSAAPKSKQEHEAGYGFQVFDAQPACERVGEPIYHSPMHICLSPDEQHAYVVNQTADSVSVLDVAEQKVLTEISVGWQPTHAVISPDGRKLYVTCMYDNVISVVDVDKQ